MSGIDSNYRVSDYLQKNNIKISSDKVNEDLGEIFQVDKLTNRFPFTTYSEGAQDFIQLLGKHSKAYITIKDGSLDKEDVSVLELENDFMNFLSESTPYFGLIRNYQFFTKLESFIEKHQEDGVERIKLFVEESNFLNVKRFTIIDDLKTIIRQEKLELSDETKAKILEIIE